MKYLDRVLDRIESFGERGGWRAYVAVVAFFTVFLTATAGLPLAAVFLTYYLGTINIWFAIVIVIILAGIALHMLKRMMYDS